jgi:diaminopimelate epimerase
MKFTKMHGLGNDYVFVNGFEESVDDPAALAPRIADRHFGVGGDGLILVLPPEAGVEADVRMRMFNADGSEAEMCGNGVRCVAKLAHDRGLTDARPMRVQTGAGVLSIDYVTDGAGRVETATVNMGEPILEPARIPVNLADLDQVVNHSISGLFDLPDSDGWVRSSGLDRRMTCVSMGNPHVVLYCRHVAAVPLERVGPIIETHRVFPRRINVHFVQTHGPRELTMRTWERGSGITLACGTGASAVCVAGVLTGRGDRSVLGHLPGGDLTLEWREADNHVYMTGPATEVFTGDWPEA